MNEQWLNLFISITNTGSMSSNHQWKYEFLLSIICRHNKVLVRSIYRHDRDNAKYYLLNDNAYKCHANLAQSFNNNYMPQRTDCRVIIFGLLTR